MIEIRRRALTWLLALAGALGPMTATAEPLAEGTVAVPPLAIEGELPKQSVRRLEERLIEGLRKGDVVIDRKMLADLAVHDAAAFSAVAAIAKQHAGPAA